MKMVDNNVCLVILCGLPGSGKTSVSNILKTSLEGTLVKDAKALPVVIEYDDLAPDGEVGFDGDAGVWKMWRDSIALEIETLLASLRRSEETEPFLQLTVRDDIRDRVKHRWKRYVDVPVINENVRETTYVLIIDDNMYYKSMRYQFYQLARHYRTGFCQVFMRCGLEACKERNQSRVSMVTHDIIDGMQERLEAPDSEKNQWESNTITCDTTKKEAHYYRSYILELIYYSLNNPVEPLDDHVNTVEKDLNRSVNLESIVHQGDLILRKIVSSRMASIKQLEPKVDMKMKYKVFADAKSQLVNKLKAGVFTDIVTEDSQWIGRLTIIMEKEFDGILKSS